MDNNVPVDAVKAESEEKKAVPWFSNPPIAYENYSYSAPFPSPLPSPLDQSQSSLFTSFDGDQPFTAAPQLWYSQMLDGQDMKSYYLMRQGFGSQAQTSEALVNSPSINSLIRGSATAGDGIGGSGNPASLSTMGGSLNPQNGSLTTFSGSIPQGGSPNTVPRGHVASMGASIHPATSGNLNAMTGPSNGLQSPPVTPYLDENLNNLGTSQ
jgi:hypothetical protein